MQAESAVEVEGVAAAEPARWATLSVLCLCFACLALDNTKLVAALPSLTRTASLSAAGAKWVVEANLLVYASLLLLGGALSERLGPRRMLLAGLALFAGASIAAAVAVTLPGLIAARGVMGIGAALITPATLSSIKHIFQPAERARAIALWTASYGLGAAAGPVLSGLLLQAWGLPTVMLINVPVAALGFLGAHRLVSGALPRQQVPLDLWGTALAFVGTALLVFALIDGPLAGWTRGLPLAALAAALLAYLGLLARELRTPYPLLDPALFRRPGFVPALLVIMLAYLAFAGGSFVLAQHLQIARGHAPTDAGLLSIPLATSMLAGTLLAPRLAARLGLPRALGAGLLAAGAGASGLSLACAASSDLALCLAQVPFGAGCGSVFANATELLIGTVPARRAGSAAAISEMVLELGGVLGIALLGAFLAPASAPASAFAAGASRALAAGALAILAAIAALGSPRGLVSGRS